MSRRNLLASIALVAAGWLLGSIDWTRPASAAEDAAAPATLQLYKDKGGDFRWRMISAEKKVVATSGIDYTDKQACMTDLEYVRKHIAAAKLTDVSDTPKQPAR